MESPLLRESFTDGGWPFNRFSIRQARLVAEGLFAQGFLRDNDIEIHKPEIERRVREGIQSGQFQDADDLLTQALDALAESSGSHSGSLDWSQCPAVESISGKVSGAWVFRNTRMPVAAVFENLEDGVTIDELVELYAGLTRDHVKAVLEFAARSLSAATPAH